MATDNEIPSSERDPVPAQSAVVEPRWQTEGDMSATPPAAVDGLVRALQPVLDWYQSDEHEERPLVDIIRDVVADLQSDRVEALMASRLLRAGNNLSFCAQITGGTVGPDVELQLAINRWDEARQALAQIERKPEDGNG